MARPEKVAVVEEIRTKLSESDAAVLTEYRGLTVHDLAELRGALRSSGTEYKVFKNTLARRAVAGAGLDDITSLFEGPVAIAFVRGDAAAAAKALRDFQKINPALIVKGGLLGARVITPADWDTRYEIYRGATFNLAHTLGQMLHLRPHNRFEDLDGMYLVGGGTHPGSGLPVIFESARISSRLLLQDLGVRADWKTQGSPPATQKTRSRQGKELVT